MQLEKKKNKNKNVSCVVFKYRKFWW